MLGHLFLAMAKFGVPKTLRTDNEAMFTSRNWCRVLKILNIKALHGPPGQPWRNGRVERLFGTLKHLLRKVNWSRVPRAGLQGVLQEFSVFYNELRPHQGLGGLTPLEAWQGKTLRDVQAEHASHQAQWLRVLTRFE